MNKFMKMFGIATVVVVALAMVVVVTGAFAQGPATPGVPDGTGQVRQGNAAGTGLGLKAVSEEDMHAAIAEALGISPEEFEAAIAEGETPYTLAIKLEVDFATVQAAMRDLHTAAFEDAVASGLVTQERANRMLNQGAQYGTANAGTTSGAGTMAGGAGYGAQGAGNGSQGSANNAQYGGSQGYGGDCPNLSQ